MLGQLAYILFSELLFSTLRDIITIGITLTGCMLIWGVLLCILVARQNKKKGGSK